MKKGLRWKILLTLVVLGFCLFMALPLKDKIKLGLDLKGGIHLVLQVKTDDSLDGETDQEINRLTEQFKKNSLTYASAVKERPGRFAITGLNIDQQTMVRDVVDQYAPDWDTAYLPDKVTFTLKPGVEALLRDQSVNQTLETVRNRVDEFGVAEPLIQRQGDDQIVVELPGVDDPDRVKDLIKVTAVLTWKLVKAGPAEDEASLLQPFGGVVPDDAEIIRGDAKRGHPGVYLVEKVAAITGSDLRTVRRGTDEWNNPAVAFTLSPEGGRRFEQVTGANIGRALAIILDNKIQSAPNINTRIGDSGIIQGQFTNQEVDDLIIVLKAGALPAGIEYLEQRVIGPALGSDSVRQGMMAGLAAIILVMSFMLVYYRLSGVNAVIAMIFNVVILFGVLAYFKANLTLPGIAGLILAIGMSVDANVLIFERIKEERAAGKNVPGAISLGFNRAFTAIFDSNLTTIISAVFLFQFGTGPIKGYAITLIISLVANVFTAVFISRLMFDITIPKTATKMSI
ncbi:MAG: protein translocase subunit SecD [Candidatus Aminicenantes bacterium]|nr:protein translocase subunit SecD [Candidatus Aminicenantes bacterium]